MELLIGTTGKEVRELQSKLMELGYDTGEVNGIFGQKTRKAVAFFQEAKDLAINGVAGPETLKALGMTFKEVKLEKERSQFNTLLLTNPNYFGNLKVSKFKPVKNIVSNTSYEELMGVGYHPHLEQLEAVIYIKKPYGYKGGVCSGGSREYVRFFADWKNDGNWEDMGMTQFTVNDIPGTKPLEYAAVLPIDPKKYFCSVENLPKVRAILSWNNPLPANDPEYPPVWGNSLDGRIQIDSLKKFTLKDLKSYDILTIPEMLESTLDLAQPIQTAAPKALSMVEREKLYRNKGVPGHRLAFKEIKTVLAKPDLLETGTNLATQMLSELKIDFAEAVKDVLKTDGNVDFEELQCIGYDPVLRGLVGIIDIKKKSGYMGNLCAKGSPEYVAFWEWDEVEAVWLHLGTTAVMVHDLTSITKEGVQYAVFMPVDFSHRQRPCHLGASVVKIRAILSWNETPPAHNPNWKPTWGNREETHIHIRPGVFMGGEITPYMDTIGDMDVCDINQSSGLATGGGVTTGYDAALESPFGGLVTITGFINNAPRFVMEGTQQPLKYKVFVRPHDPVSPHPWQPLTNNFNIKVLQQTSSDSLPYRKNITQKPDPVDGYYTYYEDVHGTAWRRVAENVLAKWHTGTSDGLWQIKIEAMDSTGTIYNGGVLGCEDGSTRSSVVICLDNQPPAPVVIDITGVQHSGVGPVDVAVSCDTFHVGDIIHGTYNVGENHFKRLSLNIIPSAPARGATVVPSERRFSMVPTTGESGSWTLDTKGMDPCGYVIRLHAVDRTIVNSSVQVGWQRNDDAGFCLQSAE